jgi:hypothetical protein
MDTTRSSQGFLRTTCLALSASAALACVAPGPARADRVSDLPQAQRTSQVYSFPARGQSEGRQDRDRYECHVWAVRQTGFDPSLPQPRQRVAPPVEVYPDPPIGSDTIAGAFGGAVVGAAVSGRRHVGDGAAIGAAAGAVLGALSDSVRAAEAKRIEASYRSRAVAASSQLDAPAEHYRRALAACLEGRGYAVR